MSFAYGFGLPHWHALSGAFSPFSLFVGGVQGAWYDPSDFGPSGTLFQDSAGTTPVTAVEQPVGLMLDKRSTPYSVFFDGTGDSLAAGTTSTFDFMHNASALFTFECWVYRTVGSTIQILFSNINTSANIGVIIGFGPGNKFGLEIYRGVSSTFVISTETSATIPTNQWTHVALTYDQSLASNNAKFYINGVFDSQATKTANAPSGSNASFAGYIGTTPSNGMPYTGYISNLRIVNAVLPISLPTAPLTPVTGTALLTCGTSWTGNPAITRNGDARGAGLNPFLASPVGNHAYQTTSASRPTLRARYNLLTYSEEFDNAAWIKSPNVTIAANTIATTDPLGGNTADKIISAPAGTGPQAQQVNQASLSLSANTTYTFSVYVKAAGWNFVFFSIYTGVSNLLANKFNLATGQLDSTHTTNAGTSTITDAGNGWYRIVGTFTTTTAVTVAAYVRTDPSAGNTFNWTGNGVDGAYAWGAQLVPTAVFPSNTYQRVGAATDYATGAAFPPYLFCDGIDDSMLTNSVDFTGTDKMLVVAGVTKNSDAGVAQILFETSSDPDANNGTFVAVGVNNGAGTKYAFASRGTTQRVADTTSATYSAPVTNVFTGIGNISGDVAALRLNGSAISTNTGDQGTGNFGNYPLYIGSRAASSFRFNGAIYSLIIAGQSYSSGQISSTESWVAAKTPLGTI